MSPVAARQHHKISRALEYLSGNELRMQIGQQRQNWLIALLKELVDNGLDAAECHGSPKIDVHIEDDRIIVRDNGPGIPHKVIEDSTVHRESVGQGAVCVTHPRPAWQCTQGSLWRSVRPVWWARARSYRGERGAAHGIRHAGPAAW